MPLNKLGALTLLALISIAGCSSASSAAAIAVVSPESTGMSSRVLARIAPIVEHEIAAGNLPGGAVEIRHRGMIVYRRSFGYRALAPRTQANDISTIYDLASMTKAIGTASAIAKLIEDAKIRLWDRVAFYDPAFAAQGKSRITVEELLVHSAGLPSALNESQSVMSEAAGERIIDEMPLHFAPGTRYEYCNTCFIELAKIVRIVSGKTLPAFDRDEIFGPMGIGEQLLFDPPHRLDQRITPEAPDQFGGYHRGCFMIKHHGCIGAQGHAGLFGTVDAVADFGQMLLDGGAFHGQRIFSPSTIDMMTRPRYLGRHTQRFGDVRGLGWDEATTDSTNRGEIFGFGGFGHTGSTGCSLWMDPATQTVVVFLSNSAHTVRADDDSIVRMYGKISTLAAAAITDAVAQAAMRREAASWSVQVAAQSRGFDAWSTHSERVWERTGQASRY